MGYCQGPSTNFKRRIASRWLFKITPMQHRNNDLIRSFGYHTELLDPERERLNAAARNFAGEIIQILDASLQRDNEWLRNNRAIMNRRVIQWCKRFSVDRESTEDDKHPGHLVIVYGVETVTKINQIVRADRRMSIRMIVEAVNADKETVIKFYTRNYTWQKSMGLVKAIKLEGQKTVTANWYTSKCLPEILQEVIVMGLMLHHDNASSHIAALLIEFL
ncbi:histone-lysine N-methyltransferase SETMAR [Trichonephila clavipes]|nr:histone-lysine N-methyltransferase SETMAR [Trichonephila clavipes]